MADGDEVIRAEASISKDGLSGTLVIGEAAPKALENLFPKAYARARIIKAITDRVVDKISSERAIDEIDADFAREVVGGEASKWMRRKEIQQRALNAYTQQVQAALPSHDGPQPDDETKSTASDWASRFWEDASLIDDEVLQEIYARILAGEAHKPGSCSMRTLRTLRSLDRSTADNFAKILPFILDGRWLPTNLEMLAPFGITYSMVMDLDEAGLLGAQTTVRTLTTDDSFMRWTNRAVRVQQGKGRQILVHSLTRAGVEVSRVAEPVYSPKQFAPLVEYIKSAVNSPVLLTPPNILNSPIPIVSWAELPHASAPTAQL